MDKLEARVRRGLEEVERCLALDWKLPNGELAHENLEHVRDILEAAHETILQGGRPSNVRLTKWVADWIPDLNDPLLVALDELEREVES